MSKCFFWQFCFFVISLQTYADITCLMNFSTRESFILLKQFLFHRTYFVSWLIFLPLYTSFSILSFSFLHILSVLQLVCEADNILELVVGDILSLVSDSAVEGIWWRSHLFTAWLFFHDSQNYVISFSSTVIPVHRRIYFMSSLGCWLLLPFPFIVFLGIVGELLWALAQEVCLLFSINFQ